MQKIYYVITLSGTPIEVTQFHHIALQRKAQYETSSKEAAVVPCMEIPEAPADPKESTQLELPLEPQKCPQCGSVDHYPGPGFRCML